MMMLIISRGRPSILLQRGDWLTAISSQLLAISFVLLLIATVSRAQTAPAAPPLLDFGMQELSIPQPTTQNVTSPRTVELLSEATHGEQGVARAQLIRDLGACQLSAGLAAVRFAMTDADPMVRAEA